MDTGIGERIRQVRMNSQEKVTQSQFGARIGVSREVITSYELNRVEPPEPTIRLICREFGVSYIWLKEGIGEMEEIPADAQTIDAIERILEGENEFVKFILRKAAKLDKAVWDALESDLREYFETKK